VERFTHRDETGKAWIGPSKGGISPAERFADYEDAQEQREKEEYVVEATGSEAIHILELLAREATGELQNMSCVGCRHENTDILKDHTAHCMHCIRNRAPFDHFEQTEADANKAADA
jgi:hypothetical protein